MRSRILGVGHALAIYVAGVVVGIQGALYLFDLYDDGAADWRSGALAVVLLLGGVGWILNAFRRDSKP